MHEICLNRDYYLRMKKKQLINAVVLIKDHLSIFQLTAEPALKRKHSNRLKIKKNYRIMNKLGDQCTAC